MKDLEILRTWKLDQNLGQLVYRITPDNEYILVYHQLGSTEKIIAYLSYKDSKKVITYKVDISELDYLGSLEVEPYLKRFARNNPRKTSENTRLQPYIESYLAEYNAALN